MIVWVPLAVTGLLIVKRVLSKKARALRRIQAAPGERPLVGHVALLKVRNLHRFSASLHVQT